MDKHCKWYNDEFCTNADSPCVADYCPVVEYPELCKHREVDEDINVRSKTEEKKPTDETTIDSLKADYYILKERYVKVLGLNEKVIAEQKAEIERLTKELEIEKDNHNTTKWQFDNSFKEVVRLLEANKELQKRVDELKSENTELYKAHTVFIAGSILEKQDIVKDTAKDIIKLIKRNGILGYGGYVIHDSTIEQIGKKYGVEVE